MICKLTGRARTKGTPSSPEERLSFVRLLRRFGVFLLGCLLIILVHLAHNHLTSALETQTLNERARGFIGEEVSRRLQGMETRVYQLATSAGRRGQDWLQSRFKEDLAAIRHDLLVLERGGRVRRVLQLNLEGQETMIREEVYQPKPGDSAYLLEVIDLVPKLAQIEAMVGELVAGLERRDHYRESLNLPGLFEEEQRLMAAYKRLTPHFVRLRENADRLLHQSHERRQFLEGEIAQRKRWFDTLQLGLVLVVLLGVGSLGLVYALDIARHHEVLRQARDEMRQSKEAAERASRAKSRFVSRMSHELRTPLNAVLGFAQLLALEPGLRPELRLQVGEINKAGNHLLGLINDVLDLAKIEAEHLEYERIAFDPLEIMDEIIAILGEQAYGKGLEVVARISPQLPARVLGDPLRLRQVILNLLGNAVKFTAQGEVGLKAEPSLEGGRILFEIWDTGPGIPREVAERLFRPFTQADESVSRRFGGSGLGLAISRELVAGMGGELGFHSQVGEGSRFSFSLPLETDPTAAGRPQPLADGVVLGWSQDPQIVKGLEEVIRVLGGRFFNLEREEEVLTLLSSSAPPAAVILDDPGPESIRRVTALSRRRPSPCLVLVKPHPEAALSSIIAEWMTPVYKPLTFSRIAAAFRLADAHPPGGVPVATGADRQGRLGRVLLVEDNPVNQLVAVKMLEHLGVQADVAADGLEALSLLERQEYPLIFMDVEMPNMNGYEASQRIRHSERVERPRVAIVAMTANALGEDRNRCLASGMDDHLPKPITIEHLSLALGRWLPGYVDKSPPGMASRQH